MTDDKRSQEAEDVARELAFYMSELSEDYYCAGWLIGLEFDLWSAVVNGPAARGGWHYLKTEEIARLKSLSDACGGWVAWKDGPRPGAGGEKFVPMAEWLDMYKRKRGEG